LKKAFFVEEKGFHHSLEILFLVAQQWVFQGSFFGCFHAHFNDFVGHRAFFPAIVANYGTVAVCADAAVDAFVRRASACAVVGGQCYSCERKRKDES
jgi:hypothetical protein